MVASCPWEGLTVSLAFLVLSLFVFSLHHAFKIHIKSNHGQSCINAAFIRACCLTLCSANAACSFFTALPQWAITEWRHLTRSLVERIALSVIRRCVQSGKVIDLLARSCCCHCCHLVIPKRQVALVQLDKHHHQSE